MPVAVLWQTPCLPFVFVGGWNLQQRELLRTFTPFPFNPVRMVDGNQLPPQSYANILVEANAGADNFLPVCQISLPASLPEGLAQKNGAQPVCAGAPRGIFG